ncbi:outer membrane lipoprotein LolB [Pseudoxanthomonas spadix BD-a59]|jgi:outer membrane lipoprotein LolB|uniref:Outer-membrane lipoprotein LolB n=1 Tax=Pseudoxanthomonas spadix (strain BD-a59) TaxID=1045855 RepID=G7US21_PSEUP|nr:lipoprotein insertase outer membrane protein LolB [Pseudoxanthomonas spadix]AER57229.1 outer membrane lipoprotein LolB [Pseudoxanthomonas spadix BD-a59]
MNRCLGRALALLAVVLLAGCVGTSVRKPLPSAVDVATAAQAQAARVQWLDAHRDWSLQGRVAIRRADKGGSGRLDWTQRGDCFEVSLSAPVTRQSWRLTGDAAEVVLEGLDGGPRRGADAGQLLLEATGWEIPVQALAFWVRGQAAPGLPQAIIEYGADGYLSALRQGGWRITYTDWRPAAGEVPAMPARVEAERGDSRVRLIIDGWRTGAAP